MMKVGVIGCGHSGPNLVRTFLEFKNCCVERVCDKDAHALARIAERFPDIRLLREGKVGRIDDR